jgi:hypothetical protein
MNEINGYIGLLSIILLTIGLIAKYIKAVMKFRGENRLPIKYAKFKEKARQQALIYEDYYQQEKASWRFTMIGCQEQARIRQAERYKQNAKLT